MDNLIAIPIRRDFSTGFFLIDLLLRIGPVFEFVKCRIEKRSWDETRAIGSGADFHHFIHDSILIQIPQLPE